MLWLLILLLGITGCASRGGTAPEQVADPLEPLNRFTFRVNLTADKYLIRPVAKVYDTLTPRPLRIGVNNFFLNLKSPIIIVNGLLQGKFRQASSDTGRLLTNSTLGLGGLLDPATPLGMPAHDEDFGQTLAVWGFRPGPYLVLPLFGPRTVRNTVGLAGDSVLHPLIFMNNTTLKWALRGLYIVHRRATLLSVDKQINESYDPYIFVRDAYVQHREYLIYDGNLPQDDDFEDEFDDEAGQ